MLLTTIKITLSEINEIKVKGILPKNRRTTCVEAWSISRSGSQYLSWGLYSPNVRLIQRIQSNS